MSSFTSSSLGRYRPAIFAITAVAAGFSLYYLYGNVQFPTSASDRPLRRRNAVHRRNRDRQETQLNGDNQDENVEFSLNIPVPDIPETTVEEESEHSWREEGEDDDSKKEGQSLLNLLYHIAEDQARKDGYVHRQVTCNSCNIMPIRGVRYRCANCIDFDLCEQCEAMQIHPRTHIFYKVRVPAPFAFLGNPRQPQPVWYPGKPSGLPQHLPRDMSKRFCTISRMEDAEINALWDQFRCLAATEWDQDPNGLDMAIDRPTFDKCFVPSSAQRPPPPNLIYDLMFAYYDMNGDGMIGFEEFLLGLSSLRSKNQDEKIRRVFRGYDLDRDGLVSRKDFLRMFRAYYVLNKELARDLVTGMDEDPFEGGGARDIVMSSQPISSAFSGPISVGEPSRTGQGKTQDAYGDSIISDGIGMTRESGLDEGDHHEVVGDFSEKKLFGNIGPNQEESDYLASMLVPDGPFVDLFDLPAAEYNIAEEFGSDNSQEDDETEDGENDEEHDHDHEEDGEAQVRININENGPDSDEVQQHNDEWPPRLVQTQDVETALGGYVALQDIQNPDDREKVKKAMTRRLFKIDQAERQSARQKGIEDRWLRRQFYLDEEDGAVAPRGLENGSSSLLDGSISLNGLANDILNKTPQEPSRRSRSSSKVRFQDDLTDGDHETRSNTSMSSRSIPIGERWGGYEIPEAEKDVGREVLYQVTQEGLNEMLDPLFRHREDLAMEVLRTRSERAKLRSQISLFNAKQGVHESIATELKATQREWRTSEIRWVILKKGQRMAGIVDILRGAEPGAFGSISPAMLAGPLQSNPVSSSTSHNNSADVEHPDPTLPQNRPNAVPLPPPESSSSSRLARLARILEPNESEPRLKFLTMLDLIEAEDEERGGPGRLTFEEFREIMASERGKSLGFVSAWIDLASF